MGMHAAGFTQADPLQRQRQIIDRWVASLAQIPAVELVWLTGSLASDRAHPGSDIDMRLAIADADYDRLWNIDKAPLLEGLGDYLILLDRGFVVLLTDESVTVDLWADQSSNAHTIEVYEWKVLLNRLPAGLPEFRTLPVRPAAEVWPAPLPSIDEVRQMNRLLLLWMTYAPGLFHDGEIVSAAGHLAFMRETLEKIMYHRLGIQHPKRSRHLRQTWPPEFVADFASTYQRGGDSALAIPALVAACRRLFDVMEKHLHALSEQVGGGYDPVWYRRVADQMKEDLQQFE